LVLSSVSNRGTLRAHDQRSPARHDAAPGDFSPHRQGRARSPGSHRGAHGACIAVWQRAAPPCTPAPPLNGIAKPRKAPHALLPARARQMHALMGTKFPPSITLGRAQRWRAHSLVKWGTSWWRCQPGGRAPVPEGRCSDLVPLCRKRWASTM